MFGLVSRMTNWSRFSSDLSAIAMRPEKTSLVAPPRRAGALAIQLRLLNASIKKLPLTTAVFGVIPDGSSLRLTSWKNRGKVFISTICSAVAILSVITSFLIGPGLRDQETHSLAYVGLSGSTSLCSGTNTSVTSASSQSARSTRLRVWSYILFPSG